MIGGLPSPGRITAIAASGRTIYMGVEDEGLVVVDASDPGMPFRVRTLALDARVDAVAANRTSAYLMTPNGLRVLDVTGEGQPFLSSPDPTIRGASVSLVGRKLHVATGEGGTRSLGDESAQAETHQVNVLNNFFAPNELTIQAGDTVRWDNFSGFHNVFACVPGELGCCGAAVESFGNSAGFPWFYQHTFTVPGSNPYVCQPHAPAMNGMKPGTVNVC